MKVNEKSHLLQRCELSLGTSKSSIYKEVLCALSPFLKDIHNALDLAAGQGHFKKFIVQHSPLVMEEADFHFHHERSLFHSIDLNENFDLKKQFDLVTIIEALHFFENPRQLLRQAHQHLAKNGLIAVTIPNLHSMTSLLSLIFKGSHSAFSGQNYPSHITPIHRIDLVHMFQELGIKILAIQPVLEGRIPGLKYHWQDIPGGKKIFKSAFFSDNLVFIGRKK